MEKNIWEYVMNSKGEVIEKVADYIGVASFAAVIEDLYRECLDEFDDAEDLEEYIADLYGKNIQSLAWEFTHKVNREMKKYLHLNDQRMDGNFANLYNDYPRHVTGTFWATDYDGDDYYDLYPQMVARLDAAEDSEQADAFITAYKGSGSYYTMRNLIMFHGARFMKNGRKMSETNSLKELESKAKLYDEEGWRMLGVLKQLIKESNIDIQGKILEWKKAKSENK